MLDKAEVAVVPGEAFGTPGYFRLSYALGDEDLVTGVTRMGEFLRDRQGLMPAPISRRPSRRSTRVSRTDSARATATARRAALAEHGLPVELRGDVDPGGAGVGVERP